MKNALILIVVAMASIYFASCKKCYQCRNQAEVCRKARYDTTLTIVVYSQILSEQYYVEYIDSLTRTGLGWSCHDTTSTVFEQVCESGLSDAALINEKNKGYICAP